MNNTKTKPTNPAAHVKSSQGPKERVAVERRPKKPKIGAAPLIRVKGNRIEIDPAEIPQLQAGLGSSDWALISGLLNQLVKVARGEDAVNEVDLNFMISAIKAIEPRDQFESFLATQMAATHVATMRLIDWLQGVKSLPDMDIAQRAVNRFARTFAMQMEAFKRHRAGGEQKITVQHVAVNGGGQAVIGNVMPSPRQTAPARNPAAAPALTHSTATPEEKLGESAPREAESAKLVSGN